MVYSCVHGQELTFEVPIGADDSIIKKKGIKHINILSNKKIMEKVEEDRRSLVNACLADDRRGIHVLV